MSPTISNKACPRYISKELEEDRFLANGHPLGLPFLEMLGQEIRNKPERKIQKKLMALTTFLCTFHPPAKKSL